MLLTRRSLLIGSCATGVSLVGGAMYVAHNKSYENQKRNIEDVFIKGFDKSGHEKYVNPRYIRWIQKEVINNETYYDVCSRMDGCAYFDTIRVHKDEMSRVVSDVDVVGR